MAKNKLKRFTENETFPFFFQPRFDELDAKGSQLKGNWQQFFGNKDPIVLELGCGKGEYTTGLAQLEPEKNYIGVDIKGARMWRGAKTVKELGLNNVAFLRSKINLIHHHFGKNEVQDIWLTFSDPQLRESRAHRRLTHPRFLSMYQGFMTKNGRVHLKTDSPELYGFTLEVIKELGLQIHYNSSDVYGELVRQTDDELRKKLEIRTFYESIWLERGLKIHYLEFNVHPYA